MREPSRIDGAPRRGNLRNRHDRLSRRGIRPDADRVKDLACGGNALIQNDNRPISGWALVLFAVVVAAFGGGLRLVAGPELLQVGPLPLMGILYGILLCSALLSVAPMGAAALPALGLRPAGWKPIVLGSIGTLILSVAVSRVGPEVKGMQAVEEVIRQPHALVPSVLVLGGLAPVAEELIFRGLLYGWVSGRWGTRAGFVVSSIAFAAAHYEPAHILLVLPLGFLFGYLRRRTDSLLPSIAAHIVNNSFAVLAAAYLDLDM